MRDEDHFDELKTELQGQRPSPGIYVAETDIDVDAIVRAAYDVEKADGSVDPERERIAKQRLLDANPRLETLLTAGQLVVLPFIQALLQDGGPAQNDQAFPGPVPDFPSWIGVLGKPKLVGRGEPYLHEGVECFDVLFEIWRHGEVITKELLIGHGLFWRLEEYTGPAGELPAGAAGAQILRKFCVYLADIVEIRRYQLRAKFSQRMRYCYLPDGTEAGEPRLLSETITGNGAHWERFPPMEKLRYEDPQVCFIELTNDGAPKWIKSYIEKFGPGIRDLGQR